MAQADVVHEHEEGRAVVGLAERVIVGDADREAGLGRARKRKRCAGESKGESEPLHPSSFLGVLQTQPIPLRRDG